MGWPDTYLHSPSDDPVDLYSELDGERNEVRKVDVYLDGRTELADELRELGTLLSELPIPALADIAQDPQFLPRVITKEEFEKIWREATKRTKS